MSKCNKCLHIEACKQWYPKLPDKYHDCCEHFAAKKRWIPVSERLPDDREKVLIWCGSLQVARIVKGISEETRAAMKRGELLDPDIPHWCLSEGLTMHKRSSVYCFGDVHGNNSVPYRWESVCGPTSWFGQDVTHWMPLPTPPKEDN